MGENLEKNTFKLHQEQNTQTQLLEVIKSLVIDIIQKNS